MSTLEPLCLVVKVDAYTWCGIHEAGALHHVRGNHIGRELNGEFSAYVESTQFGVHVGIHHAQEIHTGYAEDAQVSIASIEVFLALEDSLEMLLSATDIISQWKHLQVAICGGVFVGNILICLGIILQHLRIPIDGIDASHHSSVYDRQFPEFAVIYLSATGKYQC